MCSSQGSAVVTEQPMRRDPFLENRERLRARLRAEWIAGAEEEWLRRTGRPLSAAELERLIRRYPGDI